jgi:hypothetical protein
MSHTPGDHTTNDELLHRIDLVGEHLKAQDIQLSDVRTEQTVVRLELGAVTQRVEDNFKSFDARLLPLERIATSIDKMEKMVRWACRTGGAALAGWFFKAILDHFIH